MRVCHHKTQLWTLPSRRPWCRVQTVRPATSQPVSAPEPEPVQPSIQAEEMPQEDAPQPAESTVSAQAPLTWQASGSLHHAKGIGWYLILILILAILWGGAAWLHQWLAIAVFVAAFAALVVYGEKAPRTLTYTLDSKGLTIEGKLYPFSQFKSFGVIDDVAWQSIDLEPTKRFMPRLTIIVAPDDKDEIIDRLTAELPRLDHGPDTVERATRYLRF